MANERNAGNHEAADSEAGVHRLRDIVVEEVSLVDRAANKRRFLVVKRSKEMADSGKPKNRRASRGDTTGAAERGGRETHADSDSDVDKARARAPQRKPDDDEEAEKARRSRPAERDEDEDATDARKAQATDDADDEDPDDEEDEGESGEDEDDEDEAVGKVGVEGDEDEKGGDDDEGEASDDDDSAARRARGKRPGSKSDGDVGVTTRQTRGGKQTKKSESDELVLSSDVKNTVLGALAQALERLMAIANQVKDANEPGDDSDASTPDDLLGELEEVGELLEEIGEQLADPAEKASENKPGAARGRAARTDDRQGGGAKKPAMKAEGGKTGVPKTDVAKAGRRMAKDRLERFRKALELLSSLLKELVETKDLPVPSAGSAEKSVTKREASPGMHELVSSVQELTRIVQRQEEQLVRLQKTRATSNAIPIEASNRRHDVQEVSWPLDMNRPISRETVAKSVSFYDEE